MSVEVDAELLEFCIKMPKGELHAHLSGSVSDRTIEKLSGDVAQAFKFNVPDASSVLNLNNCFSRFKTLHGLLQTPEAIFTASKDIIEEFRKDGVIYLEIRTTPREIPGVMTKHDYLDSVLKAIHESNYITVNLLVSIDRKDDLDYSSNTVDMAIEYAKKYPKTVVGIDFSGNPNLKNAVDFKPLLEKAKHSGLKLAIHIAEVENYLDSSQLMECLPDRIGHGTFLHNKSCNGKNIIVPSSVALELCLTSNVLSGTVSSYEHHHMKFWMQARHPIVLCTDDKGVFCTSLSFEYGIAATIFSLSKLDLCEMALNSFRYSFAEESVKQSCILKLQEFCKAQLVSSNKNTELQ